MRQVGQMDRKLQTTVGGNANVDAGMFQTLTDTFFEGREDFRLNERAVNAREKSECSEEVGDASLGGICASLLNIPSRVLVGGGSRFEGREMLGIATKVNEAVAFGGQERLTSVIVGNDLDMNDVTRVGEGLFEVVNQV